MRDPEVRRRPKERRGVSASTLCRKRAREAERGPAAGLNSRTWARRVAALPRRVVRLARGDEGAV